MITLSNDFGYKLSLSKLHWKGNTTLLIAIKQSSKRQIAMYIPCSLFWWVQQVCSWAPIDTSIQQLSRVDIQSSRPQTLMGPFDTLHNSINNSIEGLINKSQGCHLVKKVLIETSRARVGVGTTDQDILHCVQAAISLFELPHNLNEKKDNLMRHDIEMHIHTHARIASQYIANYHIL